MNPLAAIRQYLAPEVASVRATQPAATGPVGGTIPAAEIQTLSPSGVASTAPTGVSPAKASFNNLLGELVGEVNGKQAGAAQAAQGLLTGQNVSLHQAVIAMEEASISFQLMVEVRNKLLESYQELMRMQV